MIVKSKSNDGGIISSKYYIVASLSSSEEKGIHVGKLGGSTNIVDYVEVPMDHGQNFSYPNFEDLYVTDYPRITGNITLNHDSGNLSLRGFPPTCWNYGVDCPSS